MHSQGELWGGCRNWTAYERDEHRGQENLLVFKLNEDGHRGSLALADTPGTAYLAQDRG